ncbi:SusC/RagA family TonB-linked outer membrane protein [Arundinibacter roseus]|uniref:TonB-dependent receptor n=1 Tax=Arundinibacter roseus TaxID=2070510 RepID=A0A4R4K614_9BACT|nr:TonB-dependent receptor [Arundinibacter roseus]TDB62773.1 TonB-dependent receptor [Arundinibacter roseus]
MKKIYNYLCTCLLVWLGCTATLHAQVKGTVLDSETSEGLPGVSILIKGTTKGVTTDQNGKFQLATDVPKTSTLIFSYIGYEKQEVEIGNQTELTITLQAAANTLEEVVVSGYGIETLRKDVTGAVSKIDKSTLQNTAPVNTTELLQGRAAGVNIISNDGSPGAGININIRGAASISAGTSPLIVIDNIPYLTSANDVFNPLAALNPNDIESLDILKDASATALYGVGATNGVIVITTKKGKKGKPRINFTVNEGIGTFANRLNVLSPQDYALYRAEISRSYAQNQFILSPGFPGMWEMLASPTIEGFSDVNFQEVLQNNYGVTNTDGNDWLNLITQNTRKRIYNFDFSGANELGTSYFASVGYTDETGVLINSGFRRLSARLNLDQRLSKFMTVGLRLQYGNTAYNGLIGDWRVDNAVAQSVFLNPFINRDNITGAPEGLINNGGQGVGPESPEYRLQQTELTRNQDQLQGTVNLSIKPTDWFELAFTGGFIPENTTRNFFVSGILREASNTRGRAEIDAERNIRWNLQPRIAINKSFGDHKINATMVYELRKNSSNRVYTRYEQFSTEVLREFSLGAASSIISIPTYFDIRDRSYIARAQYDFKSKYILTASARIDESSRFVSNRRGFFPAVSAAWNVSDEKFMDFSKTYLSALKLRVGYGITGNNQIPINAGLALANLSTVGYPFNDAVATAVATRDRFANPDITWETTEGRNLGLDIGLFNDKLAISTNLYRNVTRDLLLDIQLPAYSAFDNAIKNMGSIRNQGLEIEVQSTNIQSNTFTWRTNFNIAWNRNKILSLGGQPEIGFRVIGTGSNPNDVILRVGQPLGVFYGTIQDGLINNDIERYNSTPKVQDNNTGEFGFYDLNGDGNIDREEYVPIAYTLPKHTGGIGNTFNWKGFDLYAFLRWSFGNDVVNNNLNRAHYLRGDNNLQYNIVDQIWNRQNQDRNYQSYFAIYTTRVGATFSRSEMVEDGSFLRLETLRLGYNIPAKFTKQYKIERVRINFTGQNLFLLSRYSWYDPEVNAARGQNRQLAPGLDQGSYPRSKFYMLGLEIGF